MSLDLILEFAHHLAVFSLVGVLAAEFALISPGLSGARLRQVGLLDLSYGILAGLIVIVGFCRVYFGEAGAAFYLNNWVFSTKVGLFLVVGLLSIPPTIAILRWRRAARSDPAFTAPSDGVARVRQFFLAEFAIIALIPIFAAIMARGIGL